MLFSLNQGAHIIIGVESEYNREPNKPLKLIQDTRNHIYNITSNIYLFAIKMTIGRNLHLPQLQFTSSHKITNSVPSCSNSHLSIP